MVAQASQTTYPSRLQSGSTSLVTPAPSSFRAHAQQQQQQQPVSLNTTTPGRPRPTYRDSSASPPPQHVTPPPSNLPEREELELDDRGFVLGPGEVSAVTRGKGVSKVRSDYIMAKAAESEENLIPIRLDLDLNGGYRLKDVFLWNMNEELITPTEFATNLCTDIGIPPNYIAEIARNIRTQLEEYSPVASLQLTHEASVLVNLEVHLSRHLVTDKFEWDLSSPHPPEEFAATTCRDLGLFGEFTVALSCAIRETLMRLKKEVAEQGIPELENETAYDEPAGIRVSPETLGIEWCPSVEILSREEIEKRDGDRDRIMRRLRRDTSRFGTPVPFSTSRKRGRGDDLYGTPGFGGAGGGAAGGDGGQGSVSEYERSKWRCLWCRVSGIDTWEIRGARREFCRPCGLSIEKEGKLADWRKGMYSRRHNF